MYRKSVKLIISALLCIQPVLSGGLYAQEYIPTPVQVSGEKVRNSDGKVYYSHIVLERQTLFSISKAYGVTVDEIHAVNPKLKTDGLRKNSIILIPVKDEPVAAEPVAETVIETVTETAPEPAPVKDKDEKRKKEEKETVHTVKWYENINAIAAKYGVPAETILRYNGVTEIRKRMKLRIPPAGTVIEDAGEVAPDDEPQETVSGEDKNEDRLTEILSSVFSRKNQANMVLMLPIGAQGKVNGNYMDFYSGVLMAVRELGEKEGINTELSVYDIAGGGMPATADHLGAADFVVGPVSPEDLRKVLDMVPSNIPVISPLNQNAASLASQYENFIQAPASYYSQYRDAIHWLREDTESADRVIVISEKGKTSPITATVDTLLAHSGLNYRTFSYSILEGRNISGSLQSLMTTTGTNRILVKSESESFVYDVIRNLNLLLHSEISLVMYGTNRVRSFNTIDPIDLHNVNLHASLSYYIDYENKDIIDFLLEYRALFGTEPTQFAYQGYDLASYFISETAKGGPFMNRIGNRGKEHLLQSDFKFVKSGDKGYVNQGVRRVVYDKNFKIRLL